MGRLRRAGSSVGLGRYMVLGEVGKGGMGRVLRAYDPRLQREVALKELRGERLSEEGKRRLVAEARAMAKLSHPNVVEVYDVQQDEPGELVLVMEFVHGQTLKQWLHGQDRPWHEVVERFRNAGHGLAAAHKAGVLHRDFKPDNVLVSGLGATKVTDFGLAKLSGEDSRSETGSESVGDSVRDNDSTNTGIVMGTPRYMAPEQHRGEPLTAAADQYAFCVALWEALCGTPPFSGEGLARDKMSGPPAWPDGDVPRSIVEALRRGLAPRTGGRWPSMNALLEVLAWDPAPSHSRRLLMLGSLSALGLAAAVGHLLAATRSARCTGAEGQLMGFWDGVRRAEVKQAILGVDRSYAAEVWERTDQELEEYAEAWMAMHLEVCEATTVRGERSTAVMDLRMACLHRAVVELGAVTTQLAGADLETVQNAHELTAGLRPLPRCADVETLSEQIEPPLPAEAEAVELIRGHLANARVTSAAGHYRRAKDEIEAAKAAMVEIEYGPVRTEVALSEANVLDDLGEYEASERTLRAALKLGLRWRQRELIGRTALRLMYVVGWRLKRMQQGLQYTKLAEGLAGDEPLAQARVASALGVVLGAQGKWDHAEAQLRRATALGKQALDPDHPLLQGLRMHLAAVAQERGKFAEAEAEYRRALASDEAALGREHPAVAGVRNNLATVLREQGRYEEAEVEHRRALALWQAALGPEHPKVAKSRSNLAVVLTELGRYEEAETQSRQALALTEAAHGPNSPIVAISLDSLANTLAAQGKHAEAAARHGRALSILERAFGAEHPNVAIGRNNLANDLRSQGRNEEAEVELRRALAVLNKALDSDHPYVATLRTNLGAVLLVQGRPQEALEFAEQAWTRLQHDDMPSEFRAETAFVLARALWATSRSSDDRARARGLAERALQAFADAEDTHGEKVRTVKAWLGEHPR